MQTQVKLQYKLNYSYKKKLPVIVVAAGNSTRMGTNKQFMRIGNYPVIVRTLAAFENSPTVDRVILVVREEDKFSFQIMLEKYGINKVTDIVSGGASRQESVLNGFRALKGTDSAVLIHDGARPLVSERIISDVASALEVHKAVTCAVKVKDTLKKVDQNGKIIKTLDRSSLVAVQTPQGVWVKEYLQAAEKAGRVSAFTDDTSLMEWAGYDAYIVEGSYKNIKITTPEDISAAESFLKEEDL